MRPLVIVVAIATFVLPGTVAHAVSPDDPEVVAEIEAAKADLRKLVLGRSTNAGYDTLAAYALLKGGLPASDSAIKKVLEQSEICFVSGRYVPRQVHVYEAACHIMLLEAIDPQAYRDRMQLIVDYLQRARKESGAWNYPTDNGGGFNGDQSISQYAALGLWAAERAELDVPPALWDDLAAWELRVQTDTGGFVYHPDGNSRQEGTSSMTSAGVANLQLCTLYLYGVKAEAEREREAEQKEAPPPKFGVLQRIEVDELAEAEAETETKRSRKPENYDPRTSRTGMESALRRANTWFTPRFPPPRDRNFGHPFYYWYGVERMASLADVDTIGGTDWYDAGFDYMRNNPTNSAEHLSFKILFLSNATRELLGKKRKRGVNVASGLLAGGRGMPADLSKVVAVRDGEAEVRKSSEPLDELLAALGDPRKGETIAAQNALVEKIRLGEDREALLEHADAILELAEHENWEVRRTAIWVIGRTEDLAHADLLVEALRDENLDVAVEARNALCFLTRRPLGLGQPNDPFEGVPESATQRVREEAAEKWKTAVHAKWAGWLAEKALYDRRDRISTADRLRAESPDR